MKHRLTLIFWFTCLLLRAQVPDAGSGFALDLSGFNNSVEINNDWPVAGYPITITAWIYANPINTASRMPIVFTKDDPFRNRGFQFSLNPYGGAWFLEFGVGDGTTLTDMAIQSRIAPFSKINSWAHVAVVATGPQQVTFYVDGIPVASVLQNNNGSGVPAGGPGRPRIGGSARAGQPFFRGKIDEVTVFQGARTQQQIRDLVCQKTPLTTPGLIAYYKLDEPGGGIFLDATFFANHGTALTPSRVTSGAYIGNLSVHMYGNNLNSQNLLLQTPEGDSVLLSNYTGSSQAIHLYVVNSLPNHKNGLPQTNCVLDRYFGIYTTEVFNPSSPMFNSYFIQYRNPNYFGQDNYLRFANDDPMWAGLVTTHLSTGFNFVTNYSREFILAKNLRWQSNLPDTIQTCNFPLTLTADTLAGLPILWSNGATTSQITVSQGGYFWVRAQDSCNTVIDSVFVMDLSRLDSLIQGVSLASQVLGSNCNYPISLQAPSIPGVTHQWPNGTTGPTFQAGPGIPIFLTLFSVCDTATTDTLWLPAPVPWQSGLPPEIEVCDFPTSIQVNAHPYAHPVWSTGDTGTSINVRQSGWLFVTVADSCQERRDSVLVRLFQAPVFSPIPLSQQWAQVGCDFPFSFTFNLSQGLDITWQDGSRGNSFTASQNGWIRVWVTSRCDTVFADSLLLNLDAPVTIERGYQKFVCRANPIVLEPDFEANDYFWSSGERTRTIETDAVGIFVVYSLIDCDTLRNVFELSRPADCPEVFSTIYIPNAFTPNDDGKNDVFLVQGTRVTDFSMTILNRWGQVVFVSTDLEIGWDGHISGQMAQEGIYSYVVHFRDVDGFFRRKTGTLVLMR
jgi:gliding motility-associated-like protein